MRTIQNVIEIKPRLQSGEKIYISQKKKERKEERKKKKKDARISETRTICVHDKSSEVEAFQI